MTKVTKHVEVRTRRTERVVLPLAVVLAALRADRHEIPLGGGICVFADGSLPVEETIEVEWTIETVETTRDGQPVEGNTR